MLCWCLCCILYCKRHCGNWKLVKWSPRSFHCLKIVVSITLKTQTLNQRDFVKKLISKWSLSEPYRGLVVHEFPQGLLKSFCCERWLVSWLVFLTVEKNRSGEMCDIELEVKWALIFFNFSGYPSIRGFISGNKHRPSSNRCDQGTSLFWDENSK